jgi:hypothetical protein
MKEEREKKTLFGHIADAMGSSDTKSLFTGKKKPLIDFDYIKKLLISLAVYGALGLLLGTVIDIVLGTGYAGMALAVVFIIIWLIRKFRAYLN